ncbi:hypothetical protein LCGC14_0624420 [marine sediment metagenome]|uniref:Uncharacterized protein n=1 Tax=marine sediment metagenome TaxID=412755 RepID=A0A0F9TQD5_9ZZZZ
MADADNKGVLPRDANKNPVQAASRFDTEDGGPVRGSPGQPRRYSPMTLDGANVQELIVPGGSTHIMFQCQQLIRVGYNQNLSGGNRGNSYYVCQPLTDYELPVWNMPHIYFGRDGDSGNPVVQFMFKRLTNQKATTS